MRFAAEVSRDSCPSAGGLLVQHSVAAGKRARIPAGGEYMIAGAAAELAASLVAVPHEVWREQFAGQAGKGGRSSGRCCGRR
eukprot:scaffold374_cov271-Pinguiococcus_pyrenoidosus.AAC.8